MLDLPELWDRVIKHGNGTSERSSTRRVAVWMFQATEPPVLHIQLQSVAVSQARAITQ